MSIEQIAAGLEDLFKAEASEFLREQGDAWERFTKDLAKEVAEQIFKAKTGDASEVLEARANLEFLEASLASKIAISELEFLGQGEKALEKIIRVGLKALTLAL